MLGWLPATVRFLEFFCSNSFIFETKVEKIYIGVVSTHFLSLISILASKIMEEWNNQFYNSTKLLRPHISPIPKIQKKSFEYVDSLAKIFLFCTPRLKTPQPVLPYYTYYSYWVHFYGLILKKKNSMKGLEGVSFFTQKDTIMLSVVCIRYVSTLQISECKIWMQWHRNFRIQSLTSWSESKIIWY